MTNFTVSGRIELEAKQLVAASKEAAAALDQVKVAEQGVASAAAPAASGTEKLTKEQREAAKAAAELAREQRAAQREIQRTEQAAERSARNKARMQSQAVTYTVSDVFASAASGTPAWMIAMQQGPQLAQAFESPKAALQGLVGTIGAWRLALGATAATVLTAVAAHESYAASIREVDVAADVHNRTLGISRQAARDLADDISSLAGVSSREGRTMAAALINAGSQSTEAMKLAAGAARGFGIATGTDTATALEKLAEAMASPSKAARELARSYGVFTESEARQIEQMERSGQMWEAQQTLMEGINARFADTAKEASTVAWAIEGIGNAVSNVWDALGQMPEGLSSFVKQASQLNDGWAISMLAGAQGTASLLSGVANRREALNLQIGDIDRRVNPRETRMSQLSDEMGLVRGVLADKGVTGEDRTRAEAALNGLLREQKELKDSITRGDREAAATAQREADRAKREAERVAKQAERERARAAEDIQKRLTDMLPVYERGIAKAEQWRDASIAALDATGKGHAEFAADIDQIFNGMVADAYEEDLRRRTDWASGLKRGLMDLRRDSLDFARTSEDGLRSMSSAGEDAWRRLVTTGKTSLDELLSAFLDTLAKMSWQRLVQPGFDKGASWLLDIAGSAFKSPGDWFFNRGFDTGGWTGPAHPSTAVGLVHGNEYVFSAPATRAAGVGNLDRLHRSLKGYAEGGFVTGGAGSSSVIDMARGAGGMWQMAGIPINLTVRLVKDGKGDRIEQSQGADGGLNLDAIFDEAETRMAGNVAKGVGPLNQVLQTAFNAQRAVN
ncbi:hypothetical protein sos41_31250 [Alphaproteobacteria bacterium SO-S41]|nr:hypothetical protein sos41_31250 [Alphaproteobacteria bacterium SO-S41]